MLSCPVLEVGVFRRGISVLKYASEALRNDEEVVSLAAQCGKIIKALPISWRKMVKFSH